MVERFLAWKAWGGTREELTAREADGFYLLEQEWRTEAMSGESSGKQH